MARKTLTERRADALAEVAAAKQRLAKIEADAAERLGKMALKAGLADVDVSDEDLAKEFAALAERFQGKTVARTPRKTAAAEG
ncbi:MAG: TraC family protein [Pseudorhizobium sp.]|jgi:hypothetical protein